MKTELIFIRNINLELNINLIEVLHLRVLLFLCPFLTLCRVDITNLLFSIIFHSYLILISPSNPLLSHAYHAIPSSLVFLYFFASLHAYSFFSYHGFHPIALHTRRYTKLTFSHHLFCHRRNTYFKVYNI